MIVEFDRLGFLVGCVVNDLNAFILKLLDVWFAGEAGNLLGALDLKI